MMPIYFNAQSHLWIAYLFFVNGFLLNHVLRFFSKDYRELIESLEARILAAFFVSISLNGVLLLGLDVMAQPFDSMRLILPALSVGLLISCMSTARLSEFRHAMSFECDIWRILLYVLVFIVLFYNGGLIEQTSDAWWHMSLANKMALDSAFNLEQGHLNGVKTRYYPPLWHLNLALAKTVSGQSLAVLWNSFTAWGAALKVMAYFLLAFALSGKRIIALLSAVLFVLLPGLGDAYLRVSAWPSHISFMAWFSVFFVAFRILDSVGMNVGSLLDGVKALYSQRINIIVMLVLLLVINFSHQLEMLWFVLGFLFYFIGLCVYRTFSVNDIERIEKASWIINIAAFLLLLGVFSVGVWFFVEQGMALKGINDITLSYLLPLIVLLVVDYSVFESLLMDRQYKLTAIQKITVPKTRVSQVLFLTLAALLVLSIDARHFLSLFNPELAYPKAKYHELPSFALGWLNGELTIPGWHHQLRSGLLYAGVLSIPLSFLLAVLRPSRLTIFLASTACLSFLFCVSPYLYQWLADILNYHSPWRIGVLVFHPIVFATAIFYLAQGVVQSNDSLVRGGD